ncbi:MAG: hypothetical protein ACK56I_25600, partial [bacterium]
MQREWQTPRRSKGGARVVLFIRHMPKDSPVLVLMPTNLLRLGYSLIAGKASPVVIHASPPSPPDSYSSRKPKRLSHRRGRG